MPILAAEPDLFPDDLWLGEPAPAVADKRWWCLHTKPRQEKSVARHLRAMGATFYLPQVVSEGRTPGGRRIRSTLPLFTGYLFFHGDDHQRVEAMRGNHLANVLEVHDQEGLVGDLRHLHRVLTSGLPVVPGPSHPEGARVRLLQGPLKGLVGTVIRRRDGEHFLAVVRFLGRGATVALRDWQVERVED